MDSDKKRKLLLTFISMLSILLLVLFVFVNASRVIKEFKEDLQYIDALLNDLDKDLKVDTVPISSGAEKLEDLEKEPIRKPQENTAEPEKKPEEEKIENKEDSKEDNKKENNEQDSSDIQIGDTVIVTNLQSEYAFSKEPYTLSFTAYVKDDPSFPLKFLGNKGIKSIGKNQYTIDLYYGNNTFQIVVEKDGKVSHFTYNIIGSTELADKDNPVKGDPSKTPTVNNSLAGDLEVNSSGQYMTNTSNYTFRVDAADFNGQKIYSDHMKVYVDGALYDRPVTFNSKGEYEFSLEFEKPVVGNTVVRKISIVTWDDKGNSVYKEYEIEYTYQAVDTVTGKIRVYLDMTAVNLYVLDLGETEIKAGHTLDEYVLERLREYGFTYKYEGGYLETINHASGLFYGAEVPYLLECCIDKEIQNGGIVRWNNEWHGPNSDDGTSLGDGDFTNSSGWMYSIGEFNYPGTGLNERKPNPGDVIYLRFTLNRGKDIGASSNGYCCTYINGAEYINHHFNGGEECIYCYEKNPNYVPPQENPGDNPDEKDPEGGETPGNPDQGNESDDTTKQPEGNN